MKTTQAPTGWEALRRRVGEAVPSLEDLRTFAASGRLMPVLPIRTANGGAMAVVHLLAAALNCQRAIEGEPCGACPGCLDAFSPDGLSIVGVGPPVTETELRRLRDSLRHDQAVAWLFVVVWMDAIKRKTTKDALKAMLKDCTPRTTFVLLGGEDG